MEALGIASAIHVRLTGLPFHVFSSVLGVEPITGETATERKVV